MMAKHLQIINNKLLDLAGGKINRLIINMPPQHGKSELISKYFPVWYLGHNPDHNVILVSYQADYAAEWGKKAKDLFEEVGPTYFGKSLKKRTGSRYRWSINGFNGGMKTTGISGSITGKSADIIIIDDPIKNESEALSPVWRERVWNFFRATAYTRLSPTGKFIIIMTRWHYDDLCGRILENKDEFGEWEVVSLPAIATEDYDLIGRMKGEALFPRRYDIFNLMDKQKTLGPFWFSAEYQQEPIASEYQIFNKDKWLYYDINNPPKFSTIIQSWDTAFKENELNDYSACETWGIYNNNFYLIDIWRGKVLFPKLETTVIELSNLYKPNLILIEDAASGQDLIPVLKRDTKLNIKKITPMNKVIRAHAISPLIEQGRVFLPSKASWLPTFLNEHAKFPNGKNDDLVDTTTIFLNFVRDIKFNNPTTNKTVDKTKKTRKNKFNNY